MDYRKDKNLILAIEGGKIKGQYDWTTGINYGVKGTPIKSVSKAFDNIYTSIINSHRWITANLDGDELALALDRWERLASLGLYTPDHDLLIDPGFSFPSLKKDFVTFLHEKGESRLTRDTMFMYELQNRCESYNLLTDKYKETFDDLLYMRRDWNAKGIPLEWWCNALLRLQFEDYYYLYHYIQPDLLREYYRQCIAMGQDVPPITKNFLTTMCKTAHLYQLWKDEHMNEALKRNNDIKELYYENDKYIMFPLLTKEAFHDEAEAQNNCVERLYLEPTAEGDTHIVVIRDKKHPDKSLVTCEIRNWTIIQYYAKNNSCPSNDLMAFKKELESYLLSLSEK